MTGQDVVLMKFLASKWLSEAKKRRADMDDFSKDEDEYMFHEITAEIYEICATDLMKVLGQND